MKKVIRDDYIFEVDFDKTRGLYSGKPKGGDFLSTYLPELTHFMASLGIDIDQPENDDLKDMSDLLYTAFGTVASKNGFELDFYGQGKFVPVVVIFFHNNIIKLEVFGIRSN